MGLVDRVIQSAGIDLEPSPPENVLIDTILELMQIK